MKRLYTIRQMFDDGSYKLIKAFFGTRWEAEAFALMLGADHDSRRMSESDRIYFLTLEAEAYA